MLWCFFRGMDNNKRRESEWLPAKQRRLCRKWNLYCWGCRGQCCTPIGLETISLEIKSQIPEMMRSFFWNQDGPFWLGLSAQSGHVTVESTIVNNWRVNENEYYHWVTSRILLWDHRSRPPCGHYAECTFKTTCQTSDQKLRFVLPPQCKWDVGKQREGEWVKSDTC